MVTASNIPTREAQAQHSEAILMQGMQHACKVRIFPDRDGVSISAAAGVYCAYAAQAYFSTTAQDQ